MNLELNVVRFNNEDVIATSCDPTATHYQLYEWPAGTIKAAEMALENGNYVYAGKDAFEIDFEGELIETSSDYIGDVSGQIYTYYVEYKDMYYSYDGNTFYHCDKKHKGIEQAS